MGFLSLSEFGLAPGLSLLCALLGARSSFGILPALVGAGLPCLIHRVLSWFSHFFLL